MRGKLGYWPVLLPLAALLGAALACGGFQVRVTPTVSPTPTATAPATATPTATTAVQAALPTAVPTVTATPPKGAAQPQTLGPGAKARVAAAGGINVRETPSAKGKLLGRLSPQAVVSLLEGPTQAEDLTWWRVDNGAGLIGWAAAGPANDPWLVLAAPTATPAPAGGGGKLVSRAIKLGDRVQVTVAASQVLTVRDAAGKDGTAVARLKPGVQLVVRGGPVQQDGLTWWELEGEALKGWAAEGDGTDRWLTPIEP